ncbi:MULTISPECIES: hypothetical protein [Enterobacterales]|uniref:hypothetical protein n=1 Tax=Enterobacterales TaxID=91347 RepID=UPI002ED9AC9F
MKPYQFALLWLAFFGSYLIIVAVGYILIPEGSLFEVAVKFFGYINSEDWDNIMGYLIFIGSGLLNAGLVWSVSAACMRKQRRTNDH